MKRSPSSTPSSASSPIDMRSDTVTRPGPEMLQAMIGAQVGDDVFGDDPTVNLLQSRVAEILGKEAALFVPSGTMSNQLALKAQTSPGDQVLLEEGAHIFRYEAGGPAVLSGLLTTTIQGDGGQLTWGQVEAALNPDNVHCAPASLICLENTHNGAGGRILAQPDAVRISNEAKKRGLRVHLDGARLWHAHVATGLPLAELAAPFDSVSVCFSKALGAPIGSVLASDRRTMVRAHRFRKMWGGGMRQTGYLAAACLHALDHNLARLAEDHRRAAQIAASLDHPDLKVDHPVETNIVIVTVRGRGADLALLDHLEKQGVLAVGFGPGRVRMIPHLDIDDADVQVAVRALNSFPGAPS